MVCAWRCRVVVQVSLWIFLMILLGTYTTDYLKYREGVRIVCVVSIIANTCDVDLVELVMLHPPVLGIVHVLEDSPAPSQGATWILPARCRQRGRRSALENTHTAYTPPHATLLSPFQPIPTPTPNTLFPPPCSPSPFLLHH